MTSNSSKIFLDQLGASDRRLLEALDERGGITAGQVAKAVGWGSNIRSETQITRRRLEALRSAGLVCYLDDLKPTCWVRTSEGTKALGERP